MPKGVKIYDTTLRDGTQAENFSLTVSDKIKIALKLDDLGLHYIEGGWPGSNPKDAAFFNEIKKHELKNAVIVAFGSTHHPAVLAEDDLNLKALADSGAKAVTIFGKAWTVQVKEALNIPLEKNLEIILESLRILRPRVKELFFDAEHFFDGYKADSEYALAVLSRALEGGADCLVLCDTNGGSMPSDIRQIITKVKERFPAAELGIHAHNDSELAVANTMTAVKLGAVQVQGTINGIGERCGNANLCSIIPNLILKKGVMCLPKENLKKLSAASRFVSELANLNPNRYQPYVGQSAFAHKGGVHINAALKNPMTYEHIDPALVGNIRRILVSDLSGRSAIAKKLEDFGINLSKTDPAALKILNEVKELENHGYQFEAAEASFELLASRLLGKNKNYFQLVDYRVTDCKAGEGEAPSIEATVRIKVKDREEHSTAKGVGPVDALNNALRKSLEKIYPQLNGMKLTDYKVRVLPTNDGTAARVRVLIESCDDKDYWGTVGVSVDILEASWMALVDSFNYKLYKEEK
ncbi:MAG: citramalate synthase [Patescibacteria group bacterium]|jgi:2-isopropylmalate synthase